MSQPRRTPDHLKVHWEWREGGKSLWAKRGEHIIGMVVYSTAIGPEPVWVYKLSAVHYRWIVKGSGEVKTRAQACKSLERAWHDWLEAMEIIDVRQDPGLAVSVPRRGADPDDEEDGASGGDAGEGPRRGSPADDAADEDHVPDEAGAEANHHHVAAAPRLPGRTAP